MAFSRIDFCNRALLRLGEDPINSFDDGSAQADVARVIYPQVYEALLCDNPWTFAETSAALVKDLVAVSAEFANSFTLPNDFLSARYIIDYSFPAYRIIGKHLCVDFNAVTLVYTKLVPEQWLPPYFSDALVERLCAEFCMPIREDAELARDFMRSAVEALRSARLRDAQQDVHRAVMDYSLVTVRNF